mmetsp:Transcript_19594/g.42663  ORF Transcript_19594/g.42663 Transcript_19594/m.42663 type:complete len:253 (-) Transcript_19594:3110-3868(-)
MPLVSARINISSTGREPAGEAAPKGLIALLCYVLLFVVLVEAQQRCHILQADVLDIINQHWSWWSLFYAIRIRTKLLSTSVSNYWTIFFRRSLCYWKGLYKWLQTDCLGMMRVHLAEVVDRYRINGKVECNFWSRSTRFAYETFSSATGSIRGTLFLFLFLLPFLLQSVTETFADYLYIDFVLTILLLCTRNLDIPRPECTLCLGRSDFLDCKHNHPREPDTNNINYRERKRDSANLSKDIICRITDCPCPN